MTNKEIYNYFEKQNAYCFSTIDNGYPVTRIAHFNTYDEDGLYFMTMNVKPFYEQLKNEKTLAVAALVSDQGAATHDEDGLPGFAPGYSIRISGDVKELTVEEVKNKVEKDDKFLPLLKDQERYPTMVVFVLYKYQGEIFDFDFDKMTRDHKVIRSRFSFGGATYEKPGFFINPSKCVACGICNDVCTFNAIIPGEKYQIDGKYCDECGSCYVACPQNAIVSKVLIEEKERKNLGKKTIVYYKNKKSND